MLQSLQQNLLKSNYERLQHWPLAVTAYNHGTLGMVRAVRRVGSANLKDIINNYRSRTFGFASKNFYAEFLAASEVRENYKKYFGDIQLDEEVRFKEFIVPDFLSLSAVQDYLKYYSRQSSCAKSITKKRSFFRTCKNTNGF